MRRGCILSTLISLVTLALIGFAIFWIWCDVKHDKSAIQYIKDKSKTQVEETVGSNPDEALESNVVIDNEDVAVSMSM